MSGVMFLPYITLNYFKNIEMSQLWLYASISIIFFIPFIFLALSDQKARHNKFDQEIINDPKFKSGDYNINFMNEFRQLS